MIRGGAGIYYDFQTAFGISDDERVSLGPRGVGRGSYNSGGIPNPLTNVPGVPQGTLLQFFSPTAFTGAFSHGGAADYSRKTCGAAGKSKQHRFLNDEYRSR